VLVSAIVFTLYAAAAGLVLVQKKQDSLIAIRGYCSAISLCVAKQHKINAVGRFRINTSGHAVKYSVCIRALFPVF
jgi:hypothetical protein